MLVVRAAGQDPRQFGGRNLIADILRHRAQRRLLRRLRQLHVVRDPRAAALRREPLVDRRSRRAARWIERHQNDDGGFNVGGRGASGIDDTASAVQALVLAGRTAAARAAARRSSPASRTRRAASR